MPGMPNRLRRALAPLLLVACSQPDPIPSPSAALVFEGAAPTNLLVISIDTLRKDALERGDMPFLASIADQSVFTEANATCSSWTEPGTVCALTGFREEELGALPRPADDGEHSIDEATPTLAWWMGAAGYDTMLYSANVIHRYPAFSGDYARAEVTSDAEAELLVDQALDTTLTAPWMLHTHFFDPHTPYTSAEEWLTDLEGHPDLPYDLVSQKGQYEVNTEYSSLSAEEQEELRTQLEIRYYAQVRYLDSELERFWDTLEARGDLDDTLVVVWTDHGEQLLEHGLVGHASVMWPETNDGLLFWWARNLVPDRIDAPTMLADLLPTTMAGLGLPVPEVSGIDVGEAEANRALFGTVYPNLGTPEQQVTRDGLRLRYRWNGEAYLFDHEVDPGETDNRFRADSRHVVALWDLLRPEVEQAAALRPEEAIVDPGI